MGATVLETRRLRLRRFDLDDAAFALQMVNDPAWLANIGDRGVRTLDDARAYLENGTLSMYERLGFGTYLVELKEDGRPIGTCGLVKRDGLEDPDIGFAFLPGYRKQGYALEAAAAVLAHARDDLGMQRIVAIVSPGNERSIKLLEAIGLGFSHAMNLPGDDEEILLFATPA